ncbi:MAG: 5-(carboxyamino)imidazole ribonucleotide synthase [Bacteroidetes bacterium]|nr:5-(carboxyamino)imidazole ribonucleotide synthase [Bacteroidota bacterium]
MKVGILGGGQLGRMLLQAAANYPVETYVLENDAACPAAHLCHQFTLGDISDFDAVYDFGKQLDAITIEIESVNVDALEKLEQEGVRVYPRPHALRIIKNKIHQKQFYQANNIPSSEFIVVENAAALAQHKDFLPAVQKLGTGGYDGRGVQVLTSAADLSMAFDAPSVLEKMVEIDKEISMIVAVGENGDTAIYPPAEMVFDPALNLLDYQLSPAALPENILNQLEAVSKKVVQQLQSPGLFAVELFTDRNGKVLVNETAPRVHNSGHHSIEGNYSSQFDMLWRILLQVPLGNTAARATSVLLNLVGAANHDGTAHYEGLETVLEMPHAYVHIYGKANTKPGRKMGHVTLLGNDIPTLISEAHHIKEILRVVSK